MTQIASAKKAGTSSESLEQKIRARIDSLSYLPTTAAVAMKFVELGKDPEAEPADYAKVISADSSLSTKLLALANSSWAGVRSEVTNVKMAVNLLGLGTVRTLAISYCMTGLHNELRLSPSESKTFWQSSLCKAVAASKYAILFDTKLADEAFVAGLFQDFAVTVMYSTAREALLAILQDADSCVREQLQKERELYRLDHAEVGRLLAQKLELPELFVDAIAFHHNYERLTELIEKKALRDATYAASLLPHILETWAREDVDALSEFLQQQAPSTDLSTYLTSVQEEYSQLYSFFHEGEVPEAQLTTLLEQTAREASDKTQELVGTVNELMQNVAAMGAEVDRRVKTLEDDAARDNLTGLLNRGGITDPAKELLTKAARYGSGFAVVYLDIDKFKQINDSLGHDVGDQVLKTVAAELTKALPTDALIGRMGGDEFVALFNDCTERDAAEIGRRIVSAVGKQSARKGDAAIPLGASVGLLYVCPTNQPQNLDAAMNMADKLMYLAKRAGGSQLEVRTIRTGG
jgi:diguanylate cyclase (GGDEF)-like protein